MKLKYMILFGAASVFTLSSCGDFDFREYGEYDEDYVKLNFDNVGGLLTPIYQALDTDFGNYSGAMLASACDEAQYAYTNNAITYFYDGTWSPASPQSSMWTSCYAAIANCNLFLTKFTGLTFEDLELNSDYTTQMQRYNNYEYEVRALRAYFYFNLVRQYGAVPMPDPEEVENAEASNSLSRIPAQEVFDYIISECEDIQELIRDDYTAVAISPSETGRFSKRAVLALKARAALYAASPLFNENGDASLWERAASACKEVIDYCEGEGMALVSDYSSLWAQLSHTTAATLKELIFWRSATSESGSPESYNYPVSVTSGSGGNCPTQTLVDAYDMIDTGEPYDGGWNADSDPYTGRDPRFELSIAHNGSTWPNWNANPLQTYYNGNDGEPITGATPTGYYLKKYLQGDITFESGESNTAGYHTWITFRLGECYLNYAEALYKYLGDPYATDSDGVSANDMLNKTRVRAGMPEIPAGLSSSDWWEKYERERMVELAFEGHRFWDLRRWEEGEKTMVIDEMKIYNNGGTYSYSRETVTRGTWNDKMYLFPIPSTEIAKNPNLEQNPGW